MVIESVAFVSMAGDVLTLAATEAMLPVARGGVKEIEGIAAKVSGAAVRVVLRGGEPGVSGGTIENTAAQSVGSVRGAAFGAQTSTPPATDLRQHPLVKQAEELFGARVVKVQQRPSLEGRPESE